MARITDEGEFDFEYRHMPDIEVPNTWSERLESLVGRRRHTLLIAVGVIVVIFVALMNFGRSAPATVAPPAIGDAPSSQATGPAGTASGAGTASAAGTASPPGGVILVHVAGAVRRPGLYEMQADARVADAVEAARGPEARADLDALNLAEPLIDGQKIEVLKHGQAAPVAVPPGTPATPGGTAVPGAPLDLNTADQVALETIPGIGPVTAAAILEYRAQIGAFESIDQLLEVSGIGPATLEEMRPYVAL